MITMKKYYRYCIILIIWTILLIPIGICKFLYGVGSLHAYPILPFHACPSYTRGLGRICYSMEGILSIHEYSNEYGAIPIWIERYPELDSLCINSVLQYAWNKDSLLMEVALSDGSKQWLLASPSLISKYRCKLQEVEPPNLENLSTWHNIKLVDNTFHTFLKNMDFSVATGFFYVLLIVYVIIIILIIILNAWCFVCAVKFHNLIKVEESKCKKILYICAPIFPLAIWVMLRIITYVTIS